MDALPAPPRDPMLVAAEERREETRLVRRIRLDGGALGPINIVVSLPDPLPPERLPAMVIIGGLRSGADGIRHIADPGLNAIVGFDYPIDRRLKRDLSL